VDDLGSKAVKSEVSSTQIGEINRAIGKLADEKRVEDTKKYLSSTHSNSDLLVNVLSTTDPTLLLPSTSFVDPGTDLLSPLVKGKILNTFAQTDFRIESKKGEGVVAIIVCIYITVIRCSCEQCACSSAFR
jgi:hypothetical protein